MSLYNCWTTGSRSLPMHMCNIVKTFSKQFTQCNTKRAKKGNVKKSDSDCDKKKPKLVEVEEAERFIKDCLIASCVPEDHADIMAKTLAGSDRRGIMSHGMNRLEMYLKMLKNKALDGSAKPEILNETPATAWVDGHNGLGAVIAYFCMCNAIKKAKEVGIGLVCVKNSNHYVVPALYNLLAMRKGLIGITMSNTWPLMAPKGAQEPVLGTNPMSIGAPGENDQFLFDIATTQVAVGKIEVAARKGPSIPNGWALDKEGNPTTDAKKALEAKCLLPLGGVDFGYKGYGLAAAVDVLTGVLGDAHYSTKVVFKDGVPMNLAQMFLVINPCVFAPGFQERLSDFNKLLRNTKVADPKNALLVPGDMETLRMKAVDKAGGIEYSENQLQSCEKMSKDLNVEPLKFI